MQKILELFLMLTASFSRKWLQH